MEERQSHYKMTPIGKEQQGNGEKAAESGHQHSTLYPEAFSDTLKRYAEIQPNSKGPAPHVVRFTRRRTVRTKCILINVLLLLLLIGIAIAIYFVVTRMRTGPTDAPMLSATESPLLVEPLSTSQPILLSPSSSSLLQATSSFLSGVDVVMKTMTSSFELEVSTESVTTTAAAPEPTQVRLSGALSDQGEGRIEVLHNGEWGTVCKTLFNPRDFRVPTVFCRMLGYVGRGTYTYSRFGTGEGPIWLSSLVCLGNETSIDLCQHDEWGVNSCEHKEDVSISCL